MIMAIKDMDLWFLIRLSWLHAIEKIVPERDNDYHTNYIIDLVKSLKPSLLKWQYKDLLEIINSNIKQTNNQKLLSFKRWLEER